MNQQQISLHKSPLKASQNLIRILTRAKIWACFTPLTITTTVKRSLDVSSFINLLENPALSQAIKICSFQAPLTWCKEVPHLLNCSSSSPRCSIISSAGTETTTRLQQICLEWGLSNITGQVPLSLIITSYNRLRRTILRVRSIKRISITIISKA